MLRVSLIVLLLAGVVMADPTPGSWQAERWGQHPLGSKLPSNFGGSGNHFDVFAGATSSIVDAFLVTTLTTADQNRSASDKDTAWFGLKFVGSPNTTNHRWKITTHITGSGWAHADSIFEASSWGESLQTVSISGDNTNSDGGQLAVQDNAEVNLSISIPPGLRIAFPKAARAFERDDFETSNKVCTKGKGKCCRIRVDHRADAKGSACSTIQVASIMISANLDAEIEMVGYCTILDIDVSDRLVIKSDPSDGTASEVTPPSAGMVKGQDDVPTDKPTDDERDGEDTTGPTVDAEDLEKVLPRDFEDDPPVDSGADVEDE